MVDQLKVWSQTYGREIAIYGLHQHNSGLTIVTLQDLSIQLYSANGHISNRSILTWENFCWFFRFFWEGNLWKYDDLCNFRVFPIMFHFFDKNWKKICDPVLWQNKKCENVVLFLTADSKLLHASFIGKKKASSASPRSCQTQWNYSHTISQQVRVNYTSKWRFRSLALVWLWLQVWVWIRCSNYWL